MIMKPMIQIATYGVVDVISDIIRFARSSQLVEFPAVSKYSMFIDVHPYTGFAKCSVCAALQCVPVELGFDYGRRNACALQDIVPVQSLSAVFPRNARHDGHVPETTTGNDGSETTESETGDSDQERTRDSDRCESVAH
jgi:hypothetical protein